MELIQRMSTKNDCYQRNVAKSDQRYTTFQQRGPLGLMLHSVGTPQPRAQVFADTWNAPGREVAVHAVAQADGLVYQCLPWNFRGWHAGGAANDTHIGVEMTEPSVLRYTSGANFTCSDLPQAQAQCRGTYETAVELFAKLCRDYGLNPQIAIVSHAEGSARGIASGHADPEHLWRGLGLPYTMDTFRQAVADRLAPLYRIRRTWADAKGQLGAYRTREAAIAACPPGYQVFDEAGKAIFSNQEEEEPMTREQIIAALGDRYIRSFEELPAWAKPEMREMLDKGLIDGGESIGKDQINMLLSDIRVAIVAYRTARTER